MNENRIILGALLAPLLVIPLNGIMAVVASVFLPEPSERPIYFDVFDIIIVFSIYGVPAGYITLIFLWLPVYALLRKMK